MKKRLMALILCGTCVSLGDDYALAQAVSEKEGLGTKLDNSGLKQLDTYYQTLRGQMPGGSAVVSEAPEEPGEIEKSIKGVLDILENGNPAQRKALDTPISKWNPRFLDSPSFYREPAYDSNEGKRDPFSMTGYLWRAAQNSSGKDLNFVAGYDPEVELPKMRLRGLMKQEHRTAALLDIEGIGVHVVYEGDSVGLHQLGVNSVIKIRKFDGLSLVVETGSYGQVLIVR